MDEQEKRSEVLTKNVKKAKKTERTGKVARPGGATTSVRLEIRAAEIVQDVEELGVERVLSRRVRRGSKGTLTSATELVGWLSHSRGEDAPSEKALPGWLARQIFEHSTVGGLSTRIERDERGAAVQIDGCCDAPPLLTLDEADDPASDLRDKAACAREGEPRSVGARDEETVLDVPEDLPEDPCMGSEKAEECELAAAPQVLSNARFSEDSRISARPEIGATDRRLCHEVPRDDVVSELVEPVVDEEEATEPVVDEEIVPDPLLCHEVPLDQAQEDPS